MLHRATRIAMIAGIAAAAALPRQLAADPPDCQCETFINQLDKTFKDGDHGCMFWHKNNPHLTHVATKVAGLKDVPGDGKGYQVGCTKVDPNLKTGKAEEFEEGWQGGCASDMSKCTLKYKSPTELEKYANSCDCDIYRNGATPETEFL